MDNQTRAIEFKAKGEARLADCEKRLLDEAEIEEQMLALMAAEFDSVRREAMEECAQVCDAHARKHDLSFDAPAARTLAARIRALATPTKPKDDEDH